MLRPSEHWSWIYSAEKDRLLLDISAQAQFCSPFSGAQLALKPVCQPLSMADAQAFWEIDDSLQQLPLSPERRLECCLTAICAPFLQQLAHKSWYFQQGEQCDASPFALVTLHGLSNQYAVVVAADDDCVTCMLLGDISTLAGKTLAALQFIRVLRNRVRPYNVSTELRISA